MKLFFGDLLKNLSMSFGRRSLIWHFLAVFITVVCVLSGLDWFYFEHTRSSVLYAYFFPAAIAGFFIPVFLPLILLLYGKSVKNLKILNTAYILIHAEIASWLVSVFYKTFTGRSHPPLAGGPFTDISRVFDFGFLRGGVFWGWPSSHTIVAVAMASAMFVLYPNNKAVKLIFLLFALYIGLGVSVTIHWFSDAVAGAILGAFIGGGAASLLAAHKTVSS